MTRKSAPPPFPRFRSRQESGSAIIVTLMILTLTFLAVGSALFEASHRLRTSDQSTRWSQAGQAAEAGGEIALMTAQRNSWVADGWSAAPGAPGAAPVTKTVVLDTGVPGTGSITANLTADKVSLGAAAWLRVRSTGAADTFGGSLAGIDTRDIILRKLNLRKNRTTGATMATPQAMRTVEMLARPKSPFVLGLLLDKQFQMSGGGIIDSFDSGDPSKSTNSLYDLTKRTTDGNVGVNDTQGSSDLRSTFVYGSVAYSGPPILNTTNVQGGVTTPFNKPVDPVLPPTWTSFNPTPTIISNTATLTGGPASSPALYKVSSVTVPGGKILTIAPHAVGQESYVEIWVTGNFTTSGSGYILEQAGVHVTYHIQGDVTVSGSSFNNMSNKAENNIIEVINPPAGVSQKVTVSGSGNFIGVLNAPGADVTVSGTGAISGALIGKTLLISGGASVHYDQALARIGGNSGGAYTVATWTEAVR